MPSVGSCRQTAVAFAGRFDGHFATGFASGFKLQFHTSLIVNRRMVWN